MGYPPEHKPQTRQRIVESARYLWKAHGYANVTINQIMKDAGLTRGGFYAHFKSKDDLFAEAALDTGVMERYRALASDPNVSTREVFEGVLDYYLSAAHRDNPAEGCPLVALSEDAWRLGDGVQDAYSKLTGLAVEQLSQVLGGDQALARMTLSAMVGAVQLARGVRDEAQSLEILHATKTTLLKCCEQALS
ncbi:TetR/AcrR family transcriptional regulator [Magnetovibrio sp.]|uniref:TetR/AcrR family transcriptional regulator n=1 Tax=Magnetovibrio sp. TaxID=2024836 RepID=UPI002F935E04